jgi:hypothetical protein
MPEYRKRPVVIEAKQWTGENLREIIAFTGRFISSWEEFAADVARDGLKIYTLEGVHLANVGDWIIRGVKGEYYPCKPDIFEATYEPVAAPAMPDDTAALIAEVRKQRALGHRQFCVGVRMHDGDVESWEWETWDATAARLANALEAAEAEASEALIQGEESRKAARRYMALTLHYENLVCLEGPPNLALRDAELPVKAVDTVKLGNLFADLAVARADTARLEADARELADWRRAGKLCVEIIHHDDADGYVAKIWREMCSRADLWSGRHDTPIAAVREALAKYDAAMRGGEGQP